jgi:hypothetical protein
MTVTNGMFPLRPWWQEIRWCVLSAIVLIFNLSSRLVLVAGGGGGVASEEGDPGRRKRR